MHEERIHAALNVAAAQGVVAWWTHLEPAFTRFGIPLRPAGSDFAGILRGGLPLAVECKSVKGRRLARAAIAAEQARHLDAVAAAGGLAVLAVEFRDDATGECSTHLVPWRLVPWRVAISAQSLQRADVEDRRIRPQSSIADMVHACPSCRAVHPREGVTSPGCCFGAAAM